MSAARVRVREVVKAYGRPSYATMRRALKGGLWFTTARLEPVEGSTVDAWTVSAREMAEWLALRVPGDDRVRQAIEAAYLKDMLARFVLPTGEP